ncbi:hypothetical protein GPA10_17530 [Streptomyces sp. p1417]|uniref:Uncharacterized protein n=1 Tax=Streptomyces typhae TaxID=2681492 RepID=A0A6L6WYC5_9ACTN|nr:hypothetical protein [Streptomyces typhae]MVO86513.1 hypothetical protein [Streptomyces typhae]
MPWISPPPPYDTARSSPSKSALVTARGRLKCHVAIDRTSEGAPALNGPRRTAAHHTAPHHTAPHHTAPRRTAPRRTAPRRTTPHRAAPDQT